MNEQRTIFFEDLKVGDTITFARTITDADVRSFAEATGDTNPIHLNDEYAQKSPFGRRVAHGVLLSGVVSAILGTRFPGLGTVAREMYSKYMRPVYIGETITVEASVTELNPKLKLCRIEFKVVNQQNKVVGKGYAVVIPPSRDS